MAKKQKSYEYWLNRQAQLEQSKNMIVSQYMSEIEGILMEGKKEVKALIDSFYLRYAEENHVTLRQAKIRLNKMEKASLEEFLLEIAKKNEVKVKQMSIKARLTRLEALEIQINTTLDYMFDKIEKFSTDMLEDIAETSYYQTWYNFDCAKGVHYQFAMLDPRVIDTIARYPWSGANYSERLWQQRDELALKVKQELIKSFVTGKHPTTASKDIVEVFGTSKNKKKAIYNANRLLYTEASYVQQESTQLMYNETGVDKYQIVATLDTKTCPHCAEKDGEVHKVSEAKIGINRAPFHPNCRTTDVPYIGDEFYKSLSARIAKDENGKNFEVEDMTYQEWLKKYMSHNEKLLKKHNIL